MGDRQRDESVSPMSRTPQPPTPTSPDSTTYATPKGTDTLLPPAPIKREKSADASTGESKDYWNRGVPHALAQPVASYRLDTPGAQVNGDALLAPPLAERQPSDISADTSDAVPNGEAVSRRSVQFARPEMPEAAGHTRHGSLEGFETPSKATRGGSFMSKIKAMSGLQNPRTPGGGLDSNPQSMANSPVAARSGSQPTEAFTAEGQYDADADAELTADELNLPEGSSAPKKRKKRRMRRRREDWTEPMTPSQTTHDGDPRDPPLSSKRSRFLRRRASMPDTTAPADVGQSDDEFVRNRSRFTGWRRGAPWVDPTNRPASDDNEELDTTTAMMRRRGHSRRTTVLGGGGGTSDGDALAVRRPLFGTERAQTYGAHKWKQVKNTLKLLRQKKEDRFDYYKSAELMAELRAGAPAVLIFASMIQRDEHGNKKIPVLMEQLKIRVVDSRPDPGDEESNRHWFFTFELEYGSGPSRMNWTITRAISDLYNLHFRYKLALSNDKYVPGRLDLGARPKQPKFPFAAFPYMRRYRKKDDSSDDDDQENMSVDEGGADAAGTGMHEDGNHGLVSDAEGSNAQGRKRSRLNMMGMRRRSTGITDPGEMSAGGNEMLDPAVRRQRYVEKQRRILEKYLSEMIRWLMFRADSNRLCRFLELSALGVRLAAEGSYHGKEGFLHIQSSKGLDFRRVLTPAKMIARHSSKWFLVRQSYLVCVESPENMNIYDVYLVDSKFSIVSKRSPLKQISSKNKRKSYDLTVESPPEKHHTLTLATSERQVRLFSRNQGMLRDFEASINEMLRQTPWYEKKRFDSFAPVRQKVFAQWLVDGRDYMWNVSRAINMAKDVIYIHDWWLSPELYMRRPACISQKWRLDRLLQKKAREGVKIFVIIYRNVEAAIPIDSEYTKFSLLNLHPNIFVQRSPNQFKKNQFFFAHHEKICVVDHDVAFVGGIDLCFGRWDCPQHPITDDKPTGFEQSETPKDADHCQLYPGKDYSNPRVQDFFKLHEPYEEMYDRSKTPRMPWHDISMQVVGQPARDLTRHFVQRWNYLRRGRKPTRPLPFLLPAPDASMSELEDLGLTGTCEVQILRSACAWSLGIEETEHSIQSAYIKMIEDSEHFVYMENQFFITSTEVYGTRVNNKIGDALVDRIIRAHENDEDWRCVIVIPLMPGFQNTVDEQEGTSVRLILMCQYKSICRGEESIFGRLRAQGIDPEEYINFYSLRQWGVMENDSLVTEQLYIHAKTIIVDDRVALIGSANINERSMLGSRDSECAAIVRDTDLLWSTMGGEPYQVGRFAHTLRLRLMREHLGLDVDEILEQERQQELDREDFAKEMDQIYSEDVANTNAGPSSPSQGHDRLARLPSFNNTMGMEQAQAIESSDSSSDKGKEPMADPRVDQEAHQRDVSGYGPDNWKSAEKKGLDEGRDSVVVNGREVLVHNIRTEGKGTLAEPKAAHERMPMPENKYLEPIESTEDAMPPMPPFNRRTTEQLGLPRPAQLPSLPVVDDTDIGGPPVHHDSAGRPMSGAFHPMAADIKLAHIDKDCMKDPLNSNFIDEVWHRAAVNNTKLYRRVFRCMPDSEVSTWAEYQGYVDYGKRFLRSMEGRPSSQDREKGEDAEGSVAAAGVGAPGPEAILKAVENEVEKIPNFIGDKLHIGDMHKPAIITPDHGETAELNEKATSGAADAEEHNEKRPLSLNTSTSNDQRPRTQEAPSPVYPEGDVPFPTMTEENKHLEPQLSNTKRRERKTTFSTLDKPASRETNTYSIDKGGSMRRRRRATTKGSRRGFTIEDMPSRTDAEELMNLAQGHLVQFPYDWLLTEEHNGNWGYQVDGVAPLAI